jgi:hypothetical protein
VLEVNVEFPYALDQVVWFVFNLVREQACSACGSASKEITGWTVGSGKIVAAIHRGEWQGNEYTIDAGKQWQVVEKDLYPTLVAAETEKQRRYDALAAMDAEHSQEVTPPLLAIEAYWGDDAEDGYWVSNGVAACDVNAGDLVWFWPGADINEPTWYPSWPVIVEPKQPRTGNPIIGIAAHDAKAGEKLRVIKRVKVVQG